MHIATTITSNKTAKIIQENGFTLHPIHFDRSVGKFLALPLSFMSLYRIISNVSPDILHLVTIQPVLMGGILARFFFNCHVVYAISGLGTVFSASSFRSRIRRYLVKLIYIIALDAARRSVIFQNSYDRDTLSSLCKLSSSDVFMIPGSGVDLAKFTKLELSSTTPIVLMASRLLISKGVRDFVHAAAILYDRGINVNFHLAGIPDISNPSSISYSEYNNWSSLPYITLLGFRKDVHDLMSSAHIVCLPSYYNEGLPKVLCEAAAAGRAVITTDEPGCRDAIANGETGLLVPSHNPLALANCVEFLLSDITLLKNMGHASRKRASELFDINSIATSHLSIYNRF